MKKNLFVSVIAIIVIVFVAFFVASYFTQQKATKAAQQLLAKIQKANPKLINKITLANVNSNALDYLQHRVKLVGIKVTLAALPKNPIVIGQATLKDYQVSSNGTPSEFKLTLQGIHLQDLSGLILQEVEKPARKGAHPPKIPSFVKQLIQKQNPAITLKLHYHDKTLHVKSRFTNNALPLSSGEVTFQNFVLQQPLQWTFNDKNPAFQSFLDATIHSAKSHLNWTTDLNAAQIMKSVPMLATPLGLLGYSNFKLFINSNGKLDGKTNESTNQIHFNLKQGIDIQFASQYKRHFQVKNRVFWNYYTQLYQGMKGKKDIPEKTPFNKMMSIQSMHLQIEDRGLLDRASKLMKHSFGFGLTQFANERMPKTTGPEGQVLHFETTLLRFIANPGGQLRISIQPDTTLYSDAIEEALTQYQDLDMQSFKAIQKAKTPHQMKQVEAYYAQRKEALGDKWFKRLNLKVSLTYPKSLKQVKIASKSSGSSALKDKDS